MKKSLQKRLLKSALIAAAILGATLGKAQNLLTVNPSFETGSGTGTGSSFSGLWARANSGNSTSSASYLYRESTSPTAQDGTYYFKAVTPSESGFNSPSVLQAINGQNLTSTLTNGVTYRVSFYYQNSASHSFKVTVENNDGTNAVASLIVSTEATSWTFASFNFTLNTSTLTDGRLKIQFGSNAGTSLLDKVSIENVATLPVSLLSFSAKPLATSVLLNWETASEINNSHFEILRSENGSDFFLLKTVTAANSANKYSVEDSNPGNGTNYYKLIQYNRDGSAQELGLRAVSYNLPVAGVSVIYPNPAKESFLLDLNSLKSGVFSINLINSKGNIVQQEKIQATAGKSTHVISLNQGAAGIYTVQVKGDGFSKVFRLAVQ